tara:strand:- start:229 stop:633 length:405 start_codon:yes stop_codon:yes gene_type:complete
MIYMLDTNICIYLIKQSPKHLLERVQAMNVGDLCISSITLSELRYGVEKSQRRQHNLGALDDFVLPLEIISFDAEAAAHYGYIRHYLASKGRVIGALDILIAAHALAAKAILVTNNVKEFSRVPDLKVENWVDM